MNVFVDIDGTICETNGLEYDRAVPLHDRIEKINSLYDAGNRVTYWTARGSMSGIDHGRLTRRQLQEWGCKYHDLQFGKPVFDIYICDRVKNVKDL